jgi:peptidylprolyl isomerase
MEAMRVGGTRILQLPPALAYGSRGAGCRGPGKTDCVIPPDASLTFEVTLKDIVK